MSEQEVKGPDRSDRLFKSDKRVVRLRAATYLAPSIPIEYFEIIIEYLKNRLGYIDTSLRYEINCEKLEELLDKNEVDIAWINGANHIRLSERQKARLLPVAALHMHLKADIGPGYYSNVIIHKSLESRYKSFEDLRGCRWAYIDDLSLSGNKMCLLQLKRMGENASFFGNRMPAVSHLQCIHMVLNLQSDATAVDSNCLQIFLDRNPKYKSEIVILTSWGPLPPYPMVVKKNFSPEMEGEIIEALLEMHTFPLWSHKLAKYKVQKFVRVDEEDVTARERELIESTADMSFDVRYY